MDGNRLERPGALELKEFREFKDKSSAINRDTGVSLDPTILIMRWLSCPEQKIAVGKPEHKEIIERSLGVHCLFDEIVMEVTWGLKNLMHFLVPQEKVKLSKQDRLPMSQGLKLLLNRYDFDINPEMVNEEIIRLACLLFDCEYTDVKNTKPLRLAGQCLEEVSGIDSKDWELMKLATALRIVCYPAPAQRTRAEEGMFKPDELSKLVRDAHKYEDKIVKEVCLSIHNEMWESRDIIAEKREVLGSLIKEANEACGAEQSA
uniref:Uncharacterized protein n=1 Tax=Leersia perrieri TaxID=77586 RepID=A0A0D9WEB5_9ORYZ